MELRLPKQNPFEPFTVKESPHQFMYWKQDGRAVTSQEYDSFTPEQERFYVEAWHQDPLILPKYPVTCSLCDEDFVTRSFGIAHVESVHGPELEAQALRDLENIMTATSSGAVPTAASNRSLIEQMKEWGWQHRKTKGDWEVWKSPDGKVSVDVRPATQHVGTPAKTIKEIVEATGVDADTFWIGVDDRPGQTETEKKRVRTSGVSRRVLAVLKQHANAHLDVPTITGMIGGELTQEQVQGACSYLVGKNLIVAPLRGIYTFDSDDVEHKVGIGVDINVGGNGQQDHPAQGTAQPAQEAPERPVTPPMPIRPAPPFTVSRKDVDAISDDEINDVLDMLFPAGFKAKHLPAIDKWREATKALIASIRND